MDSVCTNRTSFDHSGLPLPYPWIYFFLYNAISKFLCSGEFKEEILKRNKYQIEKCLFSKRKKAFSTMLNKSIFEVRVTLLTVVFSEENTDHILLELGIHQTGI